MGCRLVLLGFLIIQGISAQSLSPTQTLTVTPPNTQSQSSTATSTVTSTSSINATPTATRSITVTSTQSSTPTGTNVNGLITPANKNQIGIFSSAILIGPCYYIGDYGVSFSRQQNSLAVGLGQDCTSPNTVYFNLQYCCTNDLSRYCFYSKNINDQYGIYHEHTPYGDRYNYGLRIGSGCNGVFTQGLSTMGLWSYNGSVGTAQLPIAVNGTSYNLYFVYNDVTPSVTLDVYDSNNVWTYSCGTSILTAGGLGFSLSTFASISASNSPTPQLNYPLYSSNMCRYYITFDGYFIYYTTSYNGIYVTPNGGLPGVELTNNDIFNSLLTSVTYCDSCNSDKILYALAPVTALLAITSFSTFFLH